MQPDDPDWAVSSSARKKRPIGVEMKEGRLVFTYSDGTTGVRPSSGPLMSQVDQPILNDPLPVKGRERDYKKPS